MLWYEILKIAIISDTHDRISRITKVVEILNGISIDLVIHCGDYSAPFAIEPYANLKHHMIGILGNNDAEKELISSKFRKYNKELRGDFAKLMFETVKAVAVHGHNKELLESLIESKGFDLILYGHTHHPKIEYRDKCLIINPGEVCGYLSGESTFVLLDTLSMKTELKRIT